MQSTQQQQMIHIKATFGQDIRRFETEVTYSTLVDTLRTIYRLPSSNNLIIKFLDDDQDWITFSSDAEFKHASELKLNPLKLSFQVSEQQQSVIPVPVESTPLPETTEEEEKSCERRGRCHQRRRSHEGRRGGCHQGRWGEMRGCHGRKGSDEGRRGGCHQGRWGEMKGCHEGKKGFCGGMKGSWGKNEEGPKRGMCGRKGNCRGGAIEGRFPHRRHHLVQFEEFSKLPHVERITQRINMVKSKMEKVEDEKVLQFLTFRLAKLQWKLEFIQQFDKKLPENCAADNTRKQILELKTEKRALREQLCAARKNEDQESILRLREALRNKKCAIRKLKSETFENKDECFRKRRMFRTCGTPDLENFKQCKAETHFKKCRK